MEKPEKSKFRVTDLTRAVDRDKTTLLRWEKLGLIPAAKRDSRGWRFYTEEDFSTIIRKVRESNFFRRGPVLPLMALLASGLLTLSLFSFTRFAYSNTNLNMNLNIAAGTLSVTASTTVETFSDLTYSFSSQTSTSVDVESVRIQDARGGAGSWTFNASCSDNSTAGCYWQGQTRKDRFKLNDDIGDGFDPPSTSGKLCIEMSAGGVNPDFRCLSNGGDTCGDVTLTTAYRCFTATTEITVATGASANGDYFLAEWDWAAGVPGKVSASVYTTVITYDLQ